MMINDEVYGRLTPDDIPASWPNTSNAMMTEMSLNILDVAENSTTPDATLVTIAVDGRLRGDRLTVSIADDGCGMTRNR